MRNCWQGFAPWSAERAGGAHLVPPTSLALLGASALKRPSRWAGLMNAVEIEEAVFELAAQPFDARDSLSLF
jgi:hypothetical protein